MKKLTGLFLLCALSYSAQAQSMVQKRVKKSAPDLQTYNLKLGEMYVDAKFKTTLGYDDNATSASDSSVQEEGAYILAGFELALYNQVSKDFSIDTSFFIGHKWWTSGNVSDEVVIDAKGDTLALDWDISEKTRISFVDRLRLNSNNIQEIADGEGATIMKLFTNDASLQLVHELDSKNEFGAKVGYTTREDLSNNFEFVDRDDYYAGLSYGHYLTEATKLTGFINAIKYDWDANLNNDGDEFHYGLTLDHAINNLTVVSATVGWQEMDFDNERAATADNNGNGFFGNLAINQIVSDKFYHGASVDFRRRISSDISNNFSEVTTYTYGATWFVNEAFYINPKVQYIYTDKQNTGGTETGLFAPSVTFGYDISAHLNVELTYSFTNNDSRTDDIDYNRNQLYLTVTYDF